MAEDEHKVEAILDDLGRMASETDEPSVGEVIEALGGRGFGPLIFVPALIEITPIGGIPGVPTFLAFIIVVIAVQIVLGRDHLWLPGFVERRSVSGDRLEAAAGKLRPVGKRLDRWFHGSLERLTGPGAWRVAAVICIGLCLTVPPLEFVPFASTAPMAAVAMFGLAMTFHDGRLMATAFAASALSLGVGAWAWLGS